MGRAANGSFLALLLAFTILLTTAAPRAARWQNEPLDSTADEGGVASSGTVSIAGSPAVLAFLRGVAVAFGATSPRVEVVVERSTRSRAMARLCGGDLDLAVGGRRIAATEAATCATATVPYDEYALGFDAVVLVANPVNDFADCLSVDQLRRLWAPDAAVGTWRDLDEEWPATRIGLYGTGPQSGAYQTVAQAVLGEEGAIRADFIVAENPPRAGERIATDASGLGFLPYPRFEEFRNRLTLVKIDAGKGCVAPSLETIADGSYAPLARRLYLYANRSRLNRAEVAAFLRIAFADGRGFAQAAGLVPMIDRVYAANVADLEAALAGERPPDGPPPRETPSTNAAAIRPTPCPAENGAAVDVLDGTC